MMSKLIIDSLKRLLISNRIRRVLIYYLILSLIIPNPSFASNIELDPTNTQTQLDQAQNGVPVVNIAKPTNGGVSANKFKDYNVGPDGVILNNSTKVGLSKLGGALYGNPNFDGRAANTVLFDVTGRRRSELRGYTEMFGQSAAFILANPNGIYVNGAGFINIPRAALTTGRPEIDTFGNLVGFDIDQGKVVIEGLGLNVENVDYFDIIARSAEINAEIWAGEELNIITGQNKYNYNTKEITAKNSDTSDTTGTFSIDASALGSMYANRIRLVSTEKGVGVNTQGEMLAFVGDIDITSQGDVIFAKAYAGNDIKVKAEGDIRQKEVSYAGNDIRLEARKDINIEGRYIAAENKVELDADGNLSLRKTIDNEDGEAFLTAKSLKMDAGQDITIDQADVVVTDELSLNAFQDIKISDSKRFSDRKYNG